MPDRLLEQQQLIQSIHNAEYVEDEKDIRQEKITDI